MADVMEEKRPLSRRNMIVFIGTVTAMAACLSVHGYLIIRRSLDDGKWYRCWEFAFYPWVSGVGLRQFPIACLRYLRKSPHDKHFQRVRPFSLVNFLRTLQFAFVGYFSFHVIISLTLAMIGPISICHINTKYCSTQPPPPMKGKGPLPRITVQVSAQKKEIVSSRLSLRHSFTRAFYRFYTRSPLCRFPISKSFMSPCRHVFHIPLFDSVMQS